jgi:hypothetical protein
MGCDAEEDEGSGGIAGVVTQGGGDVAVAVETQDADGEVAQARHSPGGVAGADPAGTPPQGADLAVGARLSRKIPTMPTQLIPREDTTG